MLRKSDIKDNNRTPQSLLRRLPGVDHILEITKKDPFFVVNTKKEVMTALLKERRGGFLSDIFCIAKAPDNWYAYNDSLRESLCGRTFKTFVQ